MIVESVVTTQNENGDINLAPIGIVVDDRFDWDAAVGSTVQLRPFAPSTTRDNLEVHGCGVINFVDDVLLIAQTALNLQPVPPPLVPARRISGMAIGTACSSFEFRVQSMTQEGSRWYVNCEILQGNLQRVFPGYNRAQFAILETTILATRMDWLPVDVVRRQRTEYRELVNKTAGAREREAWELVDQWIEQQLAAREE